ncbi:MAG: hypothetical protein WB952_10825, partial [Terriglobales bacterium]
PIMISRPPRFEIQRSMRRNFSFYHAFAKSHLLIAVTFSTPTPGFVNGEGLDRMHTVFATIGDGSLALTAAS